MKIIDTDKELLKKWEPLMRWWLKEAKITDTKFTVKIRPEVELAFDVRGHLDLLPRCIVLPVGSNNEEEIKFCFLHEVGHYIQLKEGRLAISADKMRGFSPEDKNLEGLANEFALKHGGSMESPYVKKVVETWGLK